MAIIRLAADDPEGAHRELSEAMSVWSQQGFQFQHHNAVVAQAQIDLYRGHALAAWDDVSQKQSAYAGSLLMRVQQIRMEVRLLAARCALAAASVAEDPRPFLHAGEQNAKRLEREQTPEAQAMARLVRAGIAHAKGDACSAVRQLTEAVAGLERAEMQLFAAAARQRLGRIMGGEEGTALVAQADAWMAGQQIRNPDCMAAMLVPGFSDGR
jgi:hypothetical protein